MCLLGHWLLICKDPGQILSRCRCEKLVLPWFWYQGWDCFFVEAVALQWDVLWAWGLGVLIRKKKLLKQAAVTLLVVKKHVCDHAFVKLEDWQVALFLSRPYLESCTVSCSLDQSSLDLLEADVYWIVLLANWTDLCLGRREMEKVCTVIWTCEGMEPLFFLISFLTLLRAVAPFQID